MDILFEPIQIGNLALKNRIVFPPMTTGYEKEGRITAQSRTFYTAVARGGAGLIILGDVSPQPSMAQTPYLFSDDFIPDLQELTTAVHTEGAKIAAQLFHQEYDTVEMRRLAQTEGRPAAMKYFRESMATFCNQLTYEQIETIQERFVAAARRAREAGFDAIQIHGDRLIGMFASPILNRREDEYGGSPANRARFALEVTRKIRAAVPEMPLDYKLAIIRTDPPRGKGGPTLAEAQQMAPRLVEAGVDAFHVCLANHGALADTIPAMGTKPYGCFVDLAARIKQVVDAPVTAVGRILHPDFAREIIDAGRADLVAIGRGLIADPDWPRKVAAAHEEDLRLCIMCNHCTDMLLARQPVTCAINAAIGAETPLSLTPAEDPGHVVVVGGGPGGMEAARVAARRGHRVTLLEKEERLGGQLNICAVPPYKEEINRLTDYLHAQLEKLNVDVHTGAPATADSITALQPNALIVATGAHPLRPDLPGGDREGVVTAWDVLAETAPVGDRVVVIGGGSVGVETALFLADRGRQVAIVEMLDAIGQEESPTLMPFIREKLAGHDVEIYTNHRVVEIGATAVQMVDEDEQAAALPYDTVVTATGSRPNDDFGHAFADGRFPIETVGDCRPEASGTIHNAIREGFFAALKV